MAGAEDLQDLIRRSNSTRQYFISLPAPDQMGLRRYNKHVKMADQLYRYVEYLQTNGRLQEPRAVSGSKLSTATRTLKLETEKALRLEKEAS